MSSLCIDMTSDIVYIVTKQWTNSLSQGLLFCRYSGLILLKMHQNKDQMLCSLMPFQPQYINEDILQKVKISIETTTNIPLGLQDLSIKHHRMFISALHLIMTNTLAGKARLDNVFRAY